MIKQQNSGATAHVVLYTPRRSKKNDYILCSLTDSSDKCITIIHKSIKNESSAVLNYSPVLGCVGRLPEK